MSDKWDSYTGLPYWPSLVSPGIDMQPWFETEMAPRFDILSNPEGREFTVTLQTQVWCAVCVVTVNAPPSSA